MRILYELQSINLCELQNNALFLIAESLAKKFFEKYSREYCEDIVIKPQLCCIRTAH